MPLRKILKEIVGSDLIASMLRIREPQTEKKNLHVRVCRAILVIAPFRADIKFSPHAGNPLTKNELGLARHPAR